MHLTTMMVRHGQMGRTRIITTWGCVGYGSLTDMRYYKYPLHGTGSHSYTTTFVDENGKPLKKNVTLSADFSKDTYEWDKMLPDYRNVNYTAEQAKAVALLNAHVANLSGYGIRADG